MTSTILSVKHLNKSFKKDETQNLLVLDDINFELRSGEIVALLGKSGSGKTTLLKILAGLIKPSQGEVHYRDRLVKGPIRGVTMVFQNYTLLPWLTVLQNVELGLEAMNVPRLQRRDRALEAIDIIGLDGFESALPHELSGGMRQRVSVARALVVHPDILLMDEPFSALDVLTAENLRSDLLDLWQSKKTKINGILFVTHSIEEAAALADRILILGNDPGYVRAELSVEMEHPRHEQSPRFHRLVDHIYTLMTTSPKGKRALQAIKAKQLSLGYRLPDADPSELSGLMETMELPEFQKRTDLPKLAEWLHLDVDALFPLTEALEILGFATVMEGDIELTSLGKMFANADALERKPIFARQLLTRIPLAQHIREVLDERGGYVSEERFLSRLEDYLSEKEAERVLSTVIDWGRYAEIFAYDYNTGMLSLENPGAEQ